MGEKAVSQSERKVSRIADILASGGYSLITSGQQPEDEPMALRDPLTEEMIHEKTGFKIVVEMPSWQTDAAGIIGFHEELERLGQDLGWDNVIGSIYVHPDTGELGLGVFVRESAFPKTSSS